MPAAYYYVRAGVSVVAENGAMELVDQQSSKYATFVDAMEAADVVRSKARAESPWLDSFTRDDGICRHMWAALHRSGIVYVWVEYTA